MSGGDREELDELRRQAARLGIVLQDEPAAPPLRAFGRELPAAFSWFCHQCPRHAGFPHHGWEPPLGLLSPFGAPSPLEGRNAEVRRLNARWPAHWVSFWHGTDGDYCFSFDGGGHAWVVYWYYNYGYTEERAHLEFRDDYEATGFADWFAGQVESALARTTGQRGESAE